MDPGEACFLPVPNPPVGTVFPSTDLIRLLETGGLLVLDGAYIDFARDHDPLPWLADWPNLVLTRTFSKSFGLAGLRVGYAMARTELIATLHKLRDSYNVNRISQAAAAAAIEAAPYYQACCRRIIECRERMVDSLRGRGFRVAPSQGNFLLARHPKAEFIYQELKRRKVLVRYFARPQLADGLRITIGAPEQNTVLLEALDTLSREGLL